MISIVIPCYNAAATITETVESAFDAGSNLREFSWAVVADTFVEAYQHCLQKRAVA
jgi:glycosyltransferase involved in cell wall biosynthesis